MQHRFWGDPQAVQDPQAQLEEHSWYPSPGSEQHCLVPGAQPSPSQVPLQAQALVQDSVPQLPQGRVEPGVQPSPVQEPHVQEPVQV
jgi:hypothetical protein